MSRVRVAVAFIALASIALYSAAEAKPRKSSKNAEALRLEEKAQKASVSGDVPGAVRLLEQGLRLCEHGGACTPKTKSQLHVSLGTVRGVGEGDYAAAKREFIVALAIDPDARLRTLATPELTAAFEEARAATLPKPSASADAGPADAGAKDVNVGELFHHDDEEENPPPPPPSASQYKPPPEPESKARKNQLSLRVIGDLAYMTDANICSPGAPSNYYCTDESGAHYTGHPQPNDNVASGFAYSTTRLVLGYERLLFAGFSAGAFAGYAFRFAPTPEGRKAFFPLHLEARATYTFGRAPFEDDGDRLAPFVFLAFGVAQVDTHVVIRVNEIPCEAKVSPACKRDLDAFRLTGNVFTTLGGGVRFRIEGPHAILGAMRATALFGDGGFVLSPEIAYQFGL